MFFVPRAVGRHVIRNCITSPFLAPLLKNRNGVGGWKAIIFP